MTIDLDLVKISCCQLWLEWGLGSCDCLDSFSEPYLMLYGNHILQVNVIRQD